MPFCIICNWYMEQLSEGEKMKKLLPLEDVQKHFKNYKLFKALHTDQEEHYTEQPARKATPLPKK